MREQQNSLPAGWRTGAFVAGTPLRAAASGLDRGFEVYDDEFVGWRRGGRATLDAALSWWRALGTDEPAFLFLHLYDAHGPYKPPDDLLGLFTSPERGRRLRRIPDYQQLYGPGGRPLERVADYSDRYDAVLRLLDGLTAEAIGAADPARTIVVVVADHGETLFERRFPLDHGARVVEEQIRIPLLLAAPGLAPGRIGATVETVDLAAGASTPSLRRGYPAAMSQVGTRRRAGIPPTPARVLVRSPLPERPQIHLIALPLEWELESTQVYLVEADPLTLSAPAITTSPVARITTGVLVVFFWKVTVTPAGMFTEVKLKMPLVCCSSMRTVIRRSIPNSGRWSSTGPSSSIRPSPTSCSTTVATKVLVLLPIRTRPSSGGAALFPSSLSPAEPTHSPRSSCTRTWSPVKPVSTISWMVFCIVISPSARCFRCGKRYVAFACSNNKHRARDQRLCS